MAGHSKWKQIKHKKAITDARRGANWTKVIREITVAAKAVNMPGDNIERAVKKGTGELEGVSYEEVTYEGYGPGGAAIIIEGSSDNPTRTVADIRYVFSRNGGNLGATNSVAWMFDRKGQLYLDASKSAEDATMEAALESGAEDFVTEGDQYVISTTVQTFHAVQDALKARKLVVDSAEIAMVPKNTVKVEGKQAEQMIKLLEALEELDDVSKVFSNFDIDASHLAEASN